MIIFIKNIFSTLIVLGQNIIYLIKGPFISNYGFSTAATPIMEGIIDLHQYILFYLAFIITLVCYLIFATISHFGLEPLRVFNLYKEYKVFVNGSTFYSDLIRILAPLIFYRLRLKEKLIRDVFQSNIEFRKNKYSHNTTLEIVWTILPSIILCAIAVPSFLLLYAMDEQMDEISVTVRVIGNQWFWHYEYTSFWPVAENNDILIPKIKEYDSYMVHENDLKFYQMDYRLLLADQKLRIPSHTPVRIIVSSADVLHSFAVPSLGIKIDAVPGRLNQVFTYVRIPGVYFGQCSEICGVNHGFMPINVQIWPKFAIGLTQKLTF